MIDDPWWMETRAASSSASPSAFWVDLDKPKRPFGFAAQPEQPKAKQKKKRKKDKHS